jgi:hypothetical protein
MTQLNTVTDCQDPAKVWADLKDGYTGKREWTQKDFVFMSPDIKKFNGTRPPYKVQMAGTADAPPGKGKPGDDWRRVEITAIVVSTGKPSEPVFVGRVKNH